jgi:hypothetical protein
MCSFNPQLRCGWQCSTRNDQLCQNIVQVNGLAVWAGAVRRRFGGDVKINTINKLSRPSSRSSSTGGAVLFRVKSDRRLNPLLGSGRAFSLLARRRQVGPVEFIFTPVTKVEASSMSSARLQTPPPLPNPRTTSECIHALRKTHWSRLSRLRRRLFVHVYVYTCILGVIFLFLFFSEPNWERKKKSLIAFFNSCCRFEYNRGSQQLLISWFPVNLQGMFRLLSFKLVFFSQKILHESNLRKINKIFFFLNHHTACDILGL